MKRTHLFTVFILVILLLTGLIGCEKEGIGGKGEIKGSAIYGDSSLKQAMFYIKYGADSSPGTDISRYDASSATDQEGNFHFKDLNKGHYYIYAVGMGDNEPIVGGMHVELEKNEHRENVQINVAP
ncbi:hypothetical protein ACFS7Z_21180 [Pontibacter toksunensis]|uniref:Carboxypeptidase regulatory-like domain-containing protein n=1 Tax=Pontibacter toksunensis TaxID=1332631 RepID=A0ABW6BYM4_9BACT